MKFKKNQANNATENNKSESKTNKNEQTNFESQPPKSQKENSGKFNKKDNLNLKKINLELEKKNQDLSNRNITLEVENLKLKDKIKLLENDFKEQIKTFEDKANEKVKTLKSDLHQKLELEKQTLKKYSIQPFFEDFLVPFLNLKQAIHFGSNSNDLAVSAYVKGFEMLMAQLENVFESFGLTKIEPQINSIFNPEEQEIYHLEKGSKDHILEVKSIGYRLHDRVIKPALVIVGKEDE
ncbi:nucleotide exchange factor GrpE [Mesomycoplasma conjunctivae]|uniref:nucleotide exchange factor GrpE n=1 Tax=Mesomycoplasma conjunctivae TaxID=45361 RepID=UPI003DA57729